MGSVVQGSQFYGHQTSSTGEVDTVLAASSNTNGVHIRTTVLAAGAESNSYIYADTSAPSAALDTSKRCIAAIGGTNGTWTTIYDDIFVPAGSGIYFSNSGDDGILFMTYDT